ncbi:MAG TPA: phage tail sheath C-terminal domain-containing protein [Acidimicrobiales bacterium]|nr:phage tail sheath C-terminal domain-containing protein [Acidimicrobiales bacterium]
MSLTTTYPGIYVQEVPSSSHTVQSAPTSVTVFVGYTHPFKTPAQNFGVPVEIFSPSDYDREFGGLFTVDWMADDVGRAVHQFFLNGGTDAWVVSLNSASTPKFNLLSAGPVISGSNAITAPSLTVGDSSAGIVFTGLEPVDTYHTLTLSITNIRTTNSTNDTADIVVAYGTRTETYRKVILDSTGSAVEAMLGTASSAVSSLVSVAHVPTGTYPAQWPMPLAPTPLTMTMPTGAFTTLDAADFAPAFADDNPLDKLTALFNLLLTPGVWDPAIVSESLAFAERKEAFVVLDPPAEAAADPTSYPLPTIGDIMSDNVPGEMVPKSVNGALYFPFLRTSDTITGSPISVAPGGYVAGMMAQEDTNRGVWKAPAGLETVLSNTTGVVSTGQMTNLRQGALNPIGVNCLRSFPGVGTVIFGARTLTAANPAFQQYRYVSVRRMALFIEQSLRTSLTWMIFEPNDTPLWVSARTTVNDWMLGLFHNGAFQGGTPSQAFQVKCDATTTTPSDQANGVVNIVVAFAPLKPAEFVVLKIAQLAGQAQS